MTKIITIFVFCLSLTGCAKNSSTTNPKSNSNNSSTSSEVLKSADIPSVFKQYKEAIVFSDGEKAVNFVSKGTIELYKKYIDWSLNANKKTLEKLQPLNKMSVLLMRHNISKNKLKKMDGKSTFIYFVNHNLVGRSDTSRAMLGDIKISGNKAVAKITDSKIKLNKFDFIKEDTWKLNLVPLIKSSNSDLKMLIKISGESENELMFNLIKEITGKKVSKNIWKPIN